MLRNKRNLVLIAATAGLVQVTSLFGTAQAASATWTGATDGNWGTATNWSPAAPAATGDDVFFYSAPATNLNITTGAARSIRTLTFNADATQQVTITSDTTNRLTVTGNTAG